jgi:hypothetical protein
MPLRISAERVWLYGTALFVFGALPAFITSAFIAPPGDWQRFWAGGATAGTSALLDENQHIAFQRAHGIDLGSWSYPPAFAWAFLPAAHLPIAVGYVLNFILALFLVGFSGWILAGVFGFQRSFGAVAALAWEPAIYSADAGQASSTWLLLVSIALAGAARASPLLLGGSLGLLLLKPTIALPFVALLVVRREWKACGIIAICAMIWYLTSVAATGGDWNWIPRYAAIVQSVYRTDLGALYNAITLPAILVRFGIAPGISPVLGAIVFLGCLPALARTNLVRAMSFTSLLVLVANVHAWMYDAAVMLPVLFYAMSHLAEPWRTRVVVAAYILAATWMPIVVLAKFNPLAIVTLGGFILCAAALYAERPKAAQMSPQLKA